MTQLINIGTAINLSDLLISRLLIQGNSGAGKSVLARKIIEESFGIVPFIVLDCDGEYYTLKEKFADVIIIGGQFADVPISLQSVKLLPKEIITNQLSVVIDLGLLKMTERIRYVKFFLETMMELPQQFWKPYLVFIEEAHKFAGEQDKQESGSAVKDLMSRGRKMGFCGIPITQRISKLHKDVAAEVNNKFIGRTNLDIDMDRASKELGFTSSSEYTRLSLRDLKKGHFYAYGTSIEPHHVHEVTIKMPETKIPRAGNIIDIKVKKPTEKILATLTKLNDLPREAKKELQDKQELQAEISRLKKELDKASAHLLTSPTLKMQEKSNQVIDGLKKQLAEMGEREKIFNNAIRERDMIIKQNGKSIANRESIIQKIYQLVATTQEQVLGKIDVKIDIPEMKKDLQNVKEFAKNVSVIGNSVQKRPQNGKQASSSGDGSLGKCSRTIISLLAGYSERSFTKSQISVLSGYSISSSTFQNSLSELNTRGMIIREGRIRVNSDAMPEILAAIGEVQPMEYNVESFKSNLAKCEREVYEILLENPSDLFTKEALASKTPSNYSPASSTYQNALSKLNILELIERSKGQIKLNPELLELM